MCGIIGEYCYSSGLTDRSTFTKLNRLNQYRGPDMEGYWTNNENCQLGFKRLSIIDLSPEGNQPILSNNKRYALVFNGEIYNYVSIKKDLLLQGIKFQSKSDSEVLVNAFQVYGIQKTLARIDGMFAIALYDKEENTISLMRDFAGIKPLFYGFTAQRLFFGSRYDQVTKHPSFYNNSVHQEVLKTYLKSHYLPAPYAIVNQTHQVEPGEVVQVSVNGKLSKRYYWRFPKVNLSHTIKEKNKAQELIVAALDEAVSSELVADVPVGSFLSGGIDSPLITYFASKRAPNIKSYTIGSDSTVFDESEKAKEYAKLIGAQHFLKEMQSKDAANILENCMQHLQEPFADFSLIPTYFVSKIAKENGSKVVLSGDGADELFYGYKRYESILKNRPYRFIPNALRYTAYGIDKVLFKNKHINSNFLKHSQAFAHQSMHSRFNDEDLIRLFGLDSIKQKELPAYQYNDGKGELEILLHMQQAEFYDMMQKTLVKVDRMSMAHSIEVRVPFLKKSFIEAATAVHPSLSYKNGGTKLLLKDILRSQLPGAPIDKIKKGFGIPLSDWLREQLKEPFEDTLFSKSFLDNFAISETVLRSVWMEHQEKRRDRKWILFTLYSLAKWQENLRK